MSESERRSYLSADELRQERIDIEAAKLWREITAKPASYCECGIFAEIEFDEPQRVAIVESVCAIRAKSDLPAWHAQVIVNAVVAAVTKQVRDTAFDRELDDDDGWDAAMAKADWSAPR